jgi:hypothetical protein
MGFTLSPEQQASAGTAGELCAAVLPEECGGRPQAYLCSSSAKNA